MTENAKKFVEFLSAQDKETQDQVSKMEKDVLIAFAAEKGFVLTDADFEEQEDDDEMSSDEMTVVAGGGWCTCPVAGGGKETLVKHPDGTESGDGGCACVIGGGGSKFDHDVRSARCGCGFVGNGDSVFPELNP